VDLGRLVTKGLIILMGRFWWSLVAPTKLLGGEGNLGLITFCRVVSEALQGLFVFLFDLGLFT